MTGTRPGLSLEALPSLNLLPLPVCSGVGMAHPESSKVLGCTLLCRVLGHSYPQDPGRGAGAPAGTKYTQGHRAVRAPREGRQTPNRQGTVRAGTGGWEGSE